MLFNSYEFIFLFLPLTMLVFHIVGSKGHRRGATAWLVGASFFFYGWWNAAYLGLIILSILFNYGTGLLLGRAANPGKKHAVLVTGVTANLALLAYYKYANFFFENVNALLGSDVAIQQIVLPLAISFFTFQQIAYLVDAYRGETQEYDFLDYCLFVTFFPQLIAGPIVHHKEMLPQFDRPGAFRLSTDHMTIGFTIFTLGLFKKVILADSVAVFASPVFTAAEAGTSLTFLEAWGGALAYSLQLYFDFSGYSDMAIGLGRMFGIRLPLNFNSPYKATSISDFWRRWHITLSRFLRDYLYIPLGGNRLGESRRLTNLLTTMVLGGLWHGAGWTFVLWGALHGIYLVINHKWRALRGKRPKSVPSTVFAWALTMLAVIVAWVPFRAESMAATQNILSAMFGGHGLSMNAMLANDVLPTPTKCFIWLLILIPVAALAPNTQQIMSRHQPAFETYKGEIPPLRYKWMAWDPTLRWAVLVSLLFTVATLGLTQVTEFLYFQF